MHPYPQPGDSGSSSLKTAVLVGAVIAMLAANVYLYMQVDVLKTEISKLRESIATEVTNLKENSSATSDTHRKSIETLKSELEAARRTAATAASHAKVEAESHADKIAKQLGERNYFELNLAKAKTPQKVGDITLLLKKTDPKKNKYTLEVYADDKMTEKKDKNLNEPIQFYVAKAGRQPYELVVNEIKKDVVKGYLATPKDQIARN